MKDVIVIQERGMKRGWMGVSESLYRPWDSHDCTLYKSE